MSDTTNAATENRPNTLTADLTSTVFDLLDAGEDLLIAGKRFWDAFRPYARVAWTINVVGMKALLRGGHCGIDGTAHHGLNPLSCKDCFGNPETLARAMTQAVKASGRWNRRHAWHKAADRIF